MSFPSVTRRTALGLAGVAAAQFVVACSSTPEPGASTSTDPDASVREEQAAAEDALIAAYDTALALGPEPTIAALLTTLRDQHIAHRGALLPEPSSPPSSPASGTARAVDLDGLIALERAAARERRAACVEASSADLTRLLALICASEASHATALAAAR